MRASKAAKEIYGTYRESLMQNPDHDHVEQLPTWEELSEPVRDAWIHAWLHAEDIVVNEETVSFQGRKER